MFFLIVFIFYTLVNLYLFLRGWKILPAFGGARKVYAIVFFILYSAFIIAMLGRETLPLEIVKPLYFIGTLWLAVTLYLTLYFLITGCFFGLKRFRRFRWIQVSVGYALVGVLLIAGNYRFNHPQRVEKTIVIHKDGGKYKDLKVLIFSDVHLGLSIDKKKLQKYVRLINAEKPDVILYAGDMVDNCTRSLNQEKMYEEINQLKAPLGMYACLGNHEYLSGIESSREFLQKTNVTVLVDSVVQVNNSFWIIGRDDRQGNKNRQSLEELVKQTNPAQPLILLDHEPYNLEEAEQNDIDLQVSGHTHHGQLWPLSLIVDKVFEIGYGYKQKTNTHIYVTSGLGLWGPPLRIGTQSEYVIFNIKFRT